MNDGISYKNIENLIILSIIPQYKFIFKNLRLDVRIYLHMLTFTCLYLVNNVTICL